MTAGAPVRIAGVSVRYPNADRRAVDAVSLDVGAGEFIVLLGPSGCGKSTLLRTINRLVEPEDGRIEVDGRDVRDGDERALRRGIGYVIQAIGLFPHLTVGRNIAVVPELLGWDRARTRARVDELLGLMRLDPTRYRDRLPRELSGGEQQRVGVARALAARPRVLLMDEPFGALDAIVRNSLQDEMLRIHATLGTTILFVTHDVDEALRLADRIVVMAGGHVEGIGRPLELLTRPANAFVAELLGASDTIRRLQLITAGEALAASRSTSFAIPPSMPTADAPQLGATATLRDALNLIIGGATDVDVVADSERVGTLTFDAIRAAIARAE